VERSDLVYETAEDTDGLVDPDVKKVRTFYAY